MIKLLLKIVFISGMVLLNSSKKHIKIEENPATETSNPAEMLNGFATTPEVLNAAEPKSYIINVAPGTPGTILLGKNKEASMKTMNFKAIDLSDPDGKSLGIQFTYDVELTNKNHIEGSSIQIDPSQFRLELDNGKKIPHDNYNLVSADAKSSAT